MISGARLEAPANAPARWTPWSARRISSAHKSCAFVACLDRIMPGQTHRHFFMPTGRWVPSGWRI